MEIEANKFLDVCCFGHQQVSFLQDIYDYLLAVIPRRFYVLGNDNCIVKIASTPAKV